MTFRSCDQVPALTSIGIDIGKDVFHIVGFDREGRLRCVERSGAKAW